MLFLMYILCSLLPVVGHILVGFILNWDIVLDVLILQGLTLLPLLGPIIAFFIYGVYWAVGLFIIQLWLAAIYK